jgi:hypothetical protein
MKKGSKKKQRSSWERATMAETREAIARAAKRLDDSQDNFRTRRLEFGRAQKLRE